MSAVLTVTDETARGEFLHRVRVELASEKLTLRELIARRIQSEVKLFNLMRPVNFKALIQPSDAIETPNGLRMSRHRDLDPEKMLQVAMKAYDSKLFYVEVDHNEVKNLDDEIVLKPGITAVAFIKVMPIVGG